MHVKHHRHRPQPHGKSFGAQVRGAFAAAGKRMDRGIMSLYPYATHPHLAAGAAALAESVAPGVGAQAVGGVKAGFHGYKILRDAVQNST